MPYWKQQHPIYLTPTFPVEYVQEIVSYYQALNDLIPVFWKGQATFEGQLVDFSSPLEAAMVALLNSSKEAPIMTDEAFYWTELDSLPAE